MGYHLRRQLREALGPDITGLQRAVALEIADDANEDTRRSWAALEDLARWTGAKDTVVVRNALKRLSVAGWEFRVPIGKGKDGRTLYAVPGTRMTFEVPPFQGVAPATPSPGSEGGSTPEGGAGAYSEEAGATPSTEQGVAGAHSEGATAHSEGATATPYYSDSSSPQEEVVAEGVAQAPPSGAAREITAEEKLEFGRFWQLHPKSRDMDKTKAAWAAAVRGGVPAKTITAAAEGYAHDVAGVEPRFIKQSANWLRERRYEDRYESTGGSAARPGLRSVPNSWQGGHRPHPATGAAAPVPTAEDYQKAVPF